MLAFEMFGDEGNAESWSCIALGDERQYGGNSGYDDDLTTKYSFDSNIANHKQLSKGDLIVLRSNDRALGMAKVEDVTSSMGTKLIRRCPLCQTTGLKERVKKHPKWRCNDGHEFEDASEAEEPVSKYEARLAGELGFEPRQTESESVVLPLHHSPINTE